MEMEFGKWDAPHPTGTLAYANCSCGTTITLSTSGMPLDQRRLLLQWFKSETERRGLCPQELLGLMRTEVRRQVLAEGDNEKSRKD